MPKCAECLYCEPRYSPERDRKVYCCTEPGTVEKFGMACKEIEESYLDNNLCPDFVSNDNHDDFEKLQAYDAKENENYVCAAIRECSANDPVEHPSHYTQGGIECIDAMKAALGEHFIGFVVGNAIKYLWRYKHKNGLEDLKKARWYLDRAIKEMEENENGK